MKRSEAEAFIRSILSDLFSFSFALVPDELQAQQIITDSISSVFLGEDELFSSDKNETAIERKAKFIESYKIKVYQKIFELGRKRFFQIKDSLDPKIINKKETLFYHMEISYRAVMFLHYKTQMSFDQIAEILKTDRVNIINQLNLARYQIEEQSQGFVI